MTAVLPEMDIEDLTDLQVPCEIKKMIESHGWAPCEFPAELVNLVVCEDCNDPRHTLNCLDCTASIQAGTTLCRKCHVGYLSVLSSERL